VFKIIYEKYNKNKSKKLKENIIHLKHFISHHYWKRYFSWTWRQIKNFKKFNIFI